RRLPAIRLVHLLDLDDHEEVSGNEPVEERTEAATHAFAGVLLELLEGEVAPVDAVDAAGDQAQQGHGRRVPRLPDGTTTSRCGSGLRLGHGCSPVWGSTGDCLSVGAPKVNDHTRLYASTSRRPSSARPSVTSSAYSRSPPTGSPLAMRVTRRPSGLSSRARYIAVASPSMFGFVARITSCTPSSPTRASSSLTFSWSGPMPSIGEIAPSRTWYRPRYSWVRSTATMSRGSSTTHSSVGSRLSSRQYTHSSPSAKLKQRRHQLTRSLASTMARARRLASSGAAFSR